MAVQTEAERALIETPTARPREVAFDPMRSAWQALDPRSIPDPGKVAAVGDKAPVSFPGTAGQS